MRRAAPCVLLSVLLSSACSRPTQTVLTLAPGQYPAAFEIAKDVLRSEHLDLERIDARAGVITTAAQSSAGLATPGDTQQSTLGQEIEDLVHNQQRTVRITFEPQPLPAPLPTPPAPSPSPRDDPRADADLTDAGVPMTMRIRVIEERIHRPEWRISTSSIRLSTRATDPELVRRQMQPQYEVALSEDRLLAARLTERISDRLRTIQKEGSR